jgi:hypothetical protein
VICSAATGHASPLSYLICSHFLHSYSFSHGLCSPFFSLTDGLTFLPCFSLHESRTAVASSTAVVTLCQFGHVCHRRNSYQLEYVHKAFTLKLIESILTDYHLLFCKMCPSFPLPIVCQQLSSDCCYSTAFQTLTLTRTNSSPCLSKHPARSLLPCLPSTA